MNLRGLGPASVVRRRKMRKASRDGTHRLYSLSWKQSVCDSSELGFKGLL